MTAVSPEVDLLADYVDRPTLAAGWRVCEKTIARYESLPDGLPFVKLGGRHIYHVQRSKRWLESRETRPNPRRAR